MMNGGACLQRVRVTGSAGNGANPRLAIAPGHRGARTGISARTRVPPPTGLSTVSVPVERSDAVLEAGQPAPVARPARRRSPSSRTSRRRRPSNSAAVTAGRGRARVLGHVGQRLGDDEVGGRLDRRRVAPSRTSTSTGSGARSASASTAAARPWFVRIAGWMPRASSRSSSRPARADSQPLVDQQCNIGSPSRDAGPAADS